MNCSSPIVDSGTRRAPAANSTSGTVVAIAGAGQQQRVPRRVRGERPAPGDLEPDQHRRRRRAPAPAVSVVRLAAPRRAAPTCFFTSPYEPNDAARTSAIHGGRP